MKQHTARTLQAFLAMLAVAAPAAAETATVEAFCVYTSDGEMSRTGPSSATFSGTLSGLFYVQTTEGPGLPSDLVCPGSIEVNLDTGAQTAKAKCTITTREGDRAFADFTCRGYHLVGCRGDFTFTGGTGRYEGLTGGGKAVVRTDLHTLTAESADTVARTSRGIIWWEALAVELR